MDSNIDISSCKIVDSPLSVAKNQRSHILFVLSNSVSGFGGEFLDWYRNDYLYEVAKLEGVLSVQHYEQCEPDADHPPPEYQYMGIFELTLDGAEGAKNIIEWIANRHSEEKSADLPATWLYYPISEKIGASPGVENPVLIVAFANGKLGSESEFREWYCTRHIRHAFNARYNANGQCFGLTSYQQPGPSEAVYEVIAVYEQGYTLQEINDYCDAMSAEELSDLHEKMRFPTLDLNRFGETCYRAITDKLSC